MKDILTRLELLRRGQLAGEDEGVQAAFVDKHWILLPADGVTNRYPIGLVLCIHMVSDCFAAVAVAQRRGHVKKMTVAETEVEG